MACGKCDWKGFLESEIMVSDKVVPQIKQCAQCKDVTAYSRRVQDLLNGKPRRPTLSIVRDGDEPEAS